MIAALIKHTGGGQATAIKSHRASRPGTGLAIRETERRTDGRTGTRKIPETTRVECAAASASAPPPQWNLIDAGGDLERAQHGADRKSPPTATNERQQLVYWARLLLDRLQSSGVFIRPSTRELNGEQAPEHQTSSSREDADDDDDDDDRLMTTTSTAVRSARVQHTNWMAFEKRLPGRSCPRRLPATLLA